ncbi:hypothetical protein [Polaribacter glomeratus]|uniref:Transcription regulator BetR N-terminal domain-containing protein n=1 Tax=Polaribacter glomeratus TaxID=102 RepID=A0A2S7WFR6_9FLAO|nr:hypothetical protein [Polaribacter glomeratus]PQJ76469.1 hypothetical protein BTO16_11200 [Polaribacter glomeratus]TXD65603.1 hypothetical protein ESX12_10510 [Polaribacter glomeratus]
MNIVEEKLFNYIKARIPQNVSFTDEIADILDISYDAAYRRIKGKTSLTLNESLQLSRHFNFNLNDIFTDKELDEERIIVEKTHPILSNNALKLFFEKGISEAQKVFSSKNGQIINCAKDYPFYHSDSGLLKSFRLYVFVNTLSKDPAQKKIPFSKFNPSAIILEKYDAFLNLYKKVSLVEVWNDSTIDNILNQIQFFYEVGLTTKEEASLIADGLKDSLKLIEEQSKNKKRALNDNSFHLYHNNIISLLNTVFMKSDTEKKVFVPYTNLTYFKVIDKNTTNQIEEYIKRQIEFSTSLSGEASFERSKFFNAMNQKIDQKMLKLLL